MKQKLRFLPARFEDIPNIIALEQDPQNKPYIFPYTIQRHREVIERDDEFLIKIVENKNNQLIGFILLALTEKEHHSMELRRIIIQPKGQGFGKLAIQFAQKFAFEEHRMQRLWLDVFTENKRAFALYLKSGFTYEGIKRKTVLEDGQYKSQYMLSMLQDEYANQTIPKTDNLMLNHTFFQVIGNSESGEVNGKTIFHYRQKDHLIWATYDGGNIHFGMLSGTINNDTLTFQYRHLNHHDEWKSGSCESIITLDQSGCIQLSESWQWQSGETGTSILKQIK